MRILNVSLTLIAIAFMSNAVAADVEVSPTGSIGGYEAKFVDPPVPR